MLTENQITIGSDPEIFASDSKNNCVPPIILEENGLEVLKQDYRESEPEIVAHSYYYLGDDLKVMSDGSAFELTVNPVSLTELEKLYNEIQRGYELTEKLINPFGFNLSIVPTIMFPIEKYSSKKYKIASEAGCDPDMDAWDEDWICKTFSTENYPYRHGGGHIHFGLPESEINFFHEYARYITKFLSMTVGSHFLTKSPESKLDSIRLNYFGKPGKFRIPKHGIEYRSPSNAWTTKKEILLDSKEWILIGLNLIYHPKAEKILDTYSKPFLEAFYNQDMETLIKIMNQIKGIYYG